MVIMSNIDRFTTDDFRVLAQLYDVQSSDGKSHMTQQEVADRLSLNRATINKIMGELKSEGYIKQDGTHNGRYILSDEAVRIVKAFKSVERKKQLKERTE